MNKLIEHNLILRRYELGLEVVGNSERLLKRQGYNYMDIRIQINILLKHIFHIIVMFLVNPMYFFMMLDFDILPSYCMSMFKN